MNLKTFVTSETMSQPSRLVLSEADTLDEAEATQAWIAIAADDVAEAKQ